MNPATPMLIEELIRHARGALTSLEKWVAKMKEETRPSVPPPMERETETNQLRPS